MKRIKLTQNKETQVSDEDFEYLNQFKWRINSRGYVIRTGPRNKIKRMNYSMHREIMNPPNQLWVDHINNDKLDNRRENLRIVTPAQNQMGKRKSLNRRTSDYKGVFKIKDKWTAAIMNNGKIMNLGMFNSEIEASEAYNNKAKELFGIYSKIGDN